MNTPWGKADHIEHLPSGVIHVSTPSHGGYYVPSHLLHIVPRAWRDVSFNGRGKAGWFEEDCDWCMVALAFPEAFPPEAAKVARDTFDAWIAPKLAKAA